MLNVLKGVNYMENNLKLIRQSKGLSQVGLAEKVDVSRQTISNLEKGKHTPSTPLALNIADALDVSVEDIFKRKMSYMFNGEKQKS